MTKEDHKGISRRQFLYRTGAAAGLTAAGMMFGSSVFANKFPSGSMRVVIPTSEGGGVDRSARAFNSVWSKYLGANFEYDYFPGAAGQVGYETYMGRRAADGQNLLFGNIGPEMIMYGTQNPSYSYPDDFIYFASVDVDDSVIWVAENSPFQTIGDLVEAGQSQRINFSTSRLPHPSSLGVLALAEATGADFRLIPYGGGSAARSAALTGEVHACATFMSSSLGVADQARFLTVFNRRNRLPSKTDDAPPVNEVFNTSIPVLSGNRTWAVHRSVKEEHPDRYEVLTRTVREAHNDPETVKAYANAGVPEEFVEFSNADECEALAESFLELTERYKEMLTG